MSHDILNSNTSTMMMLLMLLVMLMVILMTMMMVLVMMMAMTMMMVMMMVMDAPPGARQGPGAWQRLGSVWAAPGSA